MTNLIKKILFLAITGILVVLLNSCTLTEPSYSDADAIIDKSLRDGIHTDGALVITDQKSKAIPPAVQRALLPTISVANSGVKNITANDDNQQRFDIVVNNVPAKDFFMGLVKDTNYNITINHQVTGNISLELKGVTIPQTMEAARNIYGFEYISTSYGYQVFPRRLETKIFNVNYLNIGRVGQSQISLGSGQITSTIQNTLTASGLSSSQQTGSIPSGLVQTTSTINFWRSLQDNLLAIIGTQEGRSVVINQDAGSIIVKAYPDELRNVAQYLDGIQNIIQRQVIIEAKIMEVQLNANHQAGINWSLLGLNQKATDNSGGNNFTPVKALGTLSLTGTGHGGVFTSAIKLLNSQGKVTTLSSPRITTINNQKAVIKVGTDRFYITNIGSNTNNAGGGSSTTSNSVTLTPFFSGISLDITPQIDEDDYVTLHIHPIVSVVTEDIRNFNVGLTSGSTNTQVPLAKSEIRESDSIVRAKNGQVIVIGGLMTTNINDGQASTPAVSKLPGVGNLFKNTDKSSAKTELIILLYPTVVGDSNAVWQEKLQNSLNDFKKLKNTSGQFGYNLAPLKTKKMPKRMGS